MKGMRLRSREQRVKGVGREETEKGKEEFEEKT